MSERKIFPPEQRKALLQELSLIGALPPEPYRPRPSNPLALLRPSATYVRTVSHVAALSTGVSLIHGERGSGVSTFCQVLVEGGSLTALRELLGNSAYADVQLFDAHSAAAPLTADPLQIKEWSREPTALRALWMADMLRRLLRIGDLLPSDAYPPWLREDGWQSQAPAHLQPLRELLRRVSERLMARQRPLCACYDDLDDLPDALLGALASLWRELQARGLDLRAKLFLRTPRFHTLRAAAPDALRLSAATLRWSEPELFQVLVRHMVAAGPLLRDYLQEEIPALELRESPFGLLPGRMEEDARKALGERLCGVMGPDMAPVYGYRFLQSRIVDTAGEATPRTLVMLIGRAAAAALRQKTLKTLKIRRLLREEDLQAGLREAGQSRLSELRKDHALVGRLVNLAGWTLPQREADLVKVLTAPVTGEPAGLAPSGRAALDELLRLRVLHSYRQGELYDMPDLFLVGLGLRRIREPQSPKEERPDGPALLLAAQVCYEQARDGYQRESLDAVRESRQPEREEYLKKLDEGRELVLHFLEQHPDDERGCELLADLVRRSAWLLPVEVARKRFADTARRLEDALQENPEQEELLTRLGDLYQRWADAATMENEAGELLRKARAHFSASRALAPESRLAAVNLAWALLDLARCCPTEATPLLQEAEQLCTAAEQVPDKELPRTLGWLLDVRAALCAAQARWLHTPAGFDNAKELWRQAMEKAPGEARILTRWGLLLLEAASVAQDREAADKLEESLRLEPDRIATRAGLLLLRFRKMARGQEQFFWATVDSLRMLSLYAPGVVSYTLACAYGVATHASLSAKQLLIAEQLLIARRTGYLPPIHLLEQEPCLTKVLGSSEVQEVLQGWPR